MKPRDLTAIVDYPTLRGRLADGASASRGFWAICRALEDAAEAKRRFTAQMCHTVYRESCQDDRVFGVVAAKSWIASSRSLRCQTVRPVMRLFAISAAALEPDRGPKPCGTDQRLNDDAGADHITLGGLISCVWIHQSLLTGRKTLP